MKKLYPLLSVLFLISISSGQGWTSTFGGEEYESSMCLIETFDGGYFLTGSTDSYFGDGSDVYLVKTGNEGDEEWVRNYGVTWNHVGNSVCQNNDKGYSILGTIYRNSGSDLYFTRVDSVGNQLWFKEFGYDDSDVNCSDDEGFEIQKTIDGGFVLVGTKEESCNKDIWLIKTDSDGNEEWSKTFGGENRDEGYSIKQTFDSGFIITGLTYSYGTGGDIWLLKTDSDGNEEWNKTLGGDGFQRGIDIQKTIPDLGYIITGVTDTGNGEGDVIIIKTDSEGNEEWSKTFGGYGTEFCSSIKQTPDGGYIMVGQTNSFSEGDWDICLVKTDSEGNEEWNQIYGGTGNDIGTSVLNDSDGGYIFTGYSESIGSNNDYDVWLVKTTSDGTLESFESSNNPYTFSLNKPYPNPFNPSTTLDFSIPFSDNVNIRVLDIVGREVDILMNEYLTNGNHRIEWNGQGHPSGIYFISFESGGFVETKKVVLMK